MDIKLFHQLREADIFTPISKKDASTRIAPCSKCNVAPVLVKDEYGNVRLECPKCGEGTDYFSKSEQVAVRDNWNSQYKLWWRDPNEVLDPRTQAFLNKTLKKLGEDIFSPVSAEDAAARDIARPSNKPRVGDKVQFDLYAVNSSEGDWEGNYDNLDYQALKALQGQRGVVKEIVIVGDWDSDYLNVEFDNGTTLHAISSIHFTKV